MAYVQKDGVKYEKELLELADELTSGRGDGRISKDDMAQLLKSALDGQGVTDIEKATLVYIRANYKFTDSAAADFDAAMSNL